MTLLSKLLVAGVTLAAIGAAAVPARAQTQGSRSSITFKIAIDPSIGGVSIDQGAAVVSSAPAAVTQASWSDTHSKSSPLFEFDYGYAVATHTDVLVGFEFGHAGANLASVGTLNGAPLNASLDPYQYWGFEGGVRLGAGHRRGAYVSVTGGFRHVNAMGISFSTTVLTSVRPFYEASTVPSFGFNGGYLFGQSNFGIGFEVGVNYAGSLKADPGAPELSALNDQGQRWSLPVSIVLRF
ncbi:MAG TPA: hypothetical protein VH583_20535 [Vicinamibacterales bacterium]|jgi:hypothetical protein